MPGAEPGILVEGGATPTAAPTEPTPPPTPYPVYADNLANPHGISSFTLGRILIGEGGTRGDAWQPSLARLSLRHDLLAITVHDPREHDVPPIGLVELVDPATGATREVRVTAKVQERFAAAAREERDRRADALGRSRADVIELSTDGDWLGAIVQHTQRRRVQAVRGDGIGR